MAPKGLKPNPRTVTTLAIAAAMLFIGCVAVYLVAAGKLREARTELQAKQQAVEDSKRIAHRLSDAETAYRLAEEQLITLEKAVSKKAYVPTLLKQLEELAHETHLKVISVRPEEAERPAPAAQQTASAEGGESGDKKPADAQKMEPIKPYSTQTIGIEVSGNYWNAMSFLYQVTTFPKILAVESLTAEPSSTNENLRSPTLMVKLKVTAFVFDEPQQAEAPAMVKPASAPAGNEVQERKV